MSTHVNYIYFNTPETYKQRAETAPLTLEEEYEVAQELNDLLNLYERHHPSKPGYIPSHIPRLQNFVNHYQNLRHYFDATGGKINEGFTYSTVSE